MESVWSLWLTRCMRNQHLLTFVGFLLAAHRPVAIQWLRGSQGAMLWVCIFPIQWGAKELPRVSQRHSRLELEVANRYSSILIILLVFPQAQSCSWIVHTVFPSWSRLGLAQPTLASTWTAPGAKAQLSQGGWAAERGPVSGTSPWGCWPRKIISS